jgi:hypothetical protein
MNRTAMGIDIAKNVIQVHASFLRSTSLEEVW